MKKQLQRGRRATRVALTGVVLALSVSMGEAAPKAPNKAAPKPLGYYAIQRAEQVSGKKLTASQKARVVPAAESREKSIGAAQKAAYQKFWTSVAATSGVSAAEMTSPVKAKK